MIPKQKDSASLLLMVACACAALFGSGLVFSWAPTWIENLQRSQQPATGFGVPTEPPKEMPDFALIDQDGQPFKLSQLRGRPVFIFFGFTFCPDVCPVTMSEFKKVSDGLGAQAKDAVFMMITIDPERDTPEVMKKYVSAFDPTFVGLTGPVSELEIIARQYGASFQKIKYDTSEKGYTMGHSSYAYLLDRQGRWRMTYPFASPASGMAGDLRTLLAEH